MKTLPLLALCLLSAVSLCAEPRPTISSLVGRTFMVEDDFAGQSLAFQHQQGKLVAVWRVLGSGVPVISESVHPVELPSPWQAVFEVDLRDRSRGRLKVEIRSSTDVRAYLNGVRIALEEATAPPDSR